MKLDFRKITFFVAFAPLLAVMVTSPFLSKQAREFSMAISTAWIVAGFVIILIYNKIKTGRLLLLAKLPEQFKYLGTSRIRIILVSVVLVLCLIYAILRPFFHKY